MLHGSRGLLDLLNSEVEAVADDEIFVKKVRAWTDDRLSRPCDHFEHLSRCDSDDRDVVFHELFEGHARCILLDEDDVRLQTLYLLPDDPDERCLLVDLCLQIRQTFIFLDVAK